jgi:predicted flap endonuclease-1-like 5' DNA nuclease
MAKIFRLAAITAAVAIIIWLTRERLLPTPHVPHEPAPHYRSTPPPPESALDDLTAIKGVGPVYAAKLTAMGLTTYRALSETDAQIVAETLGVSPAAVTGWMSQARLRVN